MSTYLMQSEPKGKLYGRVAFRVLPLLLVAYVIAYVDRVNVGFAKLQFAQDLHFSESVFGLGAGLFFIGYMVFEVPSNLYLARVGARATLSRVMILWGLISAGTMFVGTPTQYYAMRLLLGAAEAGFFPGVILYLSYWFPTAYRGRITSGLLIGGPISGIVGGLLSGWLMSLDGLHGLRGWQVLFLYEGLPAVALGVLVLLFMEDTPDKATWLSDGERTIILADLARDAQAPAARDGLLQSLRTPFVWIMSVVYMAQIAGTSAVGLWTPTIYKGLGLSSSEIGIFTALPYVFAVVTMVVVGRSSDRSLERRWHFALSIGIAGLSGLALGLGAHSVLISAALITVAASAGWSAVAIFWTIPPTLLSETAKPSSIALISSLGALGGFFSPIVVGEVTTRTGSLYAGLAVLGIVQIVAGLFLLWGVQRTPSKSVVYGSPLHVD